MQKRFITPYALGSKVFVAFFRQILYVQNSPNYMFSLSYFSEWCSVWRYMVSWIYWMIFLEDWNFLLWQEAKFFVYVVLMNNRWFVTRILWMRRTCVRYRRSEPRVICCPGCQPPAQRPPARRGPAQSQARFCPAAGCGDTTGSGPATFLG